MKYKYEINKGVRKLRTKTSLIISGSVLGITGLVMALVMPLAANAMISNNYTLFGDASIVSGGNPGNAVQLTSTCVNGTNSCFASGGTLTFSGVDYTIPTGTTFASLTSLSTDYNFTANSCGGGSPRFQLNTSSGNIFVYLGPSPSFVGCTNGWQSTGNLIGNNDACRYDTSQIIPGTQCSTYAATLTALGSTQITGIQLVADGGWVFAGPTTSGTQTVLVDNTGINGNTYNYDQPATTSACKDGGWTSLTDTNGNHFKNQGDCVSFVATGGKNQAAGH